MRDWEIALNIISWMLIIFLGLTLVLADMVGINDPKLNIILFEWLFFYFINVLFGYLLNNLSNIALRVEIASVLTLLSILIYVLIVKNFTIFTLIFILSGFMLGSFLGDKNR